ncbi:glycosyltransferase family A protein [Janibacter anophelis]|uniref:glycosyltransferase family A protein n=1 Tax=Janibacter anophelis TaxID=319054 RepID=UPI000831CBC7|nr:glycosyltransferase family A protein [Janibacter anophelis]
MPTLQRARSLAAGGIRAVLTGDPAARRRVVDPLRARLRPTPLAGLDPLLAGYARGAEQVGVDDVVATALRTRSPLLREAVRALAERTGAVSWRAGYAELLLTSGDDDLIRQGSAIMRELVEGGDGATITTRQALLHAHTLLLRQAAHGEGADVLRRHLPRLTQLSPDERADLETDLAHPSLTGDEATWWRQLTRRWREAGVLVPRLLTQAELAQVIGEETAAAFPGGAPAYDRVGPDPAELAERRAGVAQRVSAAIGREVTEADLPTISVVVTAYRPGPWLATAIRALLDQTWPHLDVVVVDDASGPEHTDEIARIAGLHPQARVITRERNGGAYRARNLGIREAKGEYLAFLDADDWSHPERLERQVTALLADPDLPATHGLTIRPDDDLRLVWLGYPSVRLNASGLVMPRSTIERVGTFDDVRKSADTEYDSRIPAVTGRAVALVEPPLQLTRLRSGSLSRSDFGVGWGIGPRLAYRSAYKAWHRHLDDVRAKGGLPGQPGAEFPDGPPPDLVLDWATRDGESDPDRDRAEGRPFAAPHVWVSTRPHAPFDVLVVDDAADTMVDPTQLYGELEDLLDLDVRIALLHRENPARLRLYRKPLLPAVRHLLDRADDVVQVHPEERVEAALTWIRRPESLSVGRPAPDLSPGHVVVTEPTTSTTHRVDPAWTRAAVEAELATWGVPEGSALWLPEDEARRHVHLAAEGLR